MGYSDNQLSEWRELNELNVTEFMLKTRPTFFITKCRLNAMNCKLSWKPRQTVLGTCLELETRLVRDPRLAKENEKVSSLFEAFSESVDTIW